MPIDYAKAPLPKPVVPQTKIDYSSMPKIDYSAAPRPAPIKPVVNLTNEMNKGMDKFWGGVGDMWDKAGVSDVWDDLTKPMMPDVEEDIINKAGELPLVGPLAKSTARFMTEGSTSKLGVATLGAAGLGAKLIRKGASYLGKGKKAANALGEVHGPLTLDDTFKLEIDKAKPIRGAQEQLYSDERSRRVKEMLKVKAKGEVGFFKQKSKLKDPLPLMPFDTVRDKFSGDTIDTLFDRIEASKVLSPLDKISAKEGLSKVMGSVVGGVPERSELALLEKVFPGTAKSLASKDKKSLIYRTASAPRAIMSADIGSAPLRQSAFMIGRKGWWTSWDDMFKAYSAEGTKAIGDRIKSGRHYDLGQRGGLAITDIEETYDSTVSALPVIKHAARGFTGYSNVARDSIYTDLVDSALKISKGATDKKMQKFYDPYKNAKLNKELAEYVNAGTGRGDLGLLEKHAEALNAALFSPRLMSSRLGLIRRALIDPFKAPINMGLRAMGKTEYERIHPFVRKQYWRDLFTFAGTQAAIMSVAKIGGAEVGDEPTSSDWGKIKIGNARLDFNGGFQPYFRAAAQLAQEAQTSSISNKRVELGEGYRAKTKKDIIYSFIESKEAPLLNFAINFAEGIDFTGNPATLSSEIGSKLTPIILQDLKEILVEDPTLLWTLIPANFGAGLQVYGSETLKKAPKKSPYEVNAVTLPKF